MEKERRAAAADAAAAAAKVPPPPLPLPPNLTVAQLPKLLRPTGKRFQAARGHDAEPDGTRVTTEVTEPPAAADEAAGSSSHGLAATVGELSGQNRSGSDSCPRHSPSHCPQASENSGSDLKQESETQCDRELPPSPSHPTHGDSHIAASLVPQQAPPEVCLLSEPAPDAPEISDDPSIQAKPDIQLAEAVSQILSDVGALSTECKRLFKDTCASGDCEAGELVDAEQLHKLTQMLIDRFGCTSPATLDRIGHVYVAATSGRLEQGLPELEFRGYVAAVLTQILQDLERRSVTTSEEEKASEATGAEESDSFSMVESLQGWLAQLTSSFA
ncbi:unnamed protein product [Symbiodinium natans]|uniref:Uncharacterized protein n=1 Tax=Symbiodinium natans TaxID=878477 RepID=A0A812S942_9DINO|nr:unnamed protein product [Symbiodinium natans]